MYSIWFVFSLINLNYLQMKKEFYQKCSFVLLVSLLISANLFSQITGPTPVCGGTTANVYTAPAGMQSYVWSITGGGKITSGAGTNAINIAWTLAGPWDITVVYPDPIKAPITDTLKLTVTVNAPTITGPVDPISLMPATLGNGVTPGQVYTTEAGMTNYVWNLSSAGKIDAGNGTNSISATWTSPPGQQLVKVTYTNPITGCTSSNSLIINYYPFAGAIDPTTIPQFVDPLPHFAAGLRVNAKAGGNLFIRAVPVKQVAVSTGTVLANGKVGDPLTPNAGKGTYAAYEISKDNFVTPGVPMWPAQTIEAQVDKPLMVQYQNNLTGITYANFNILSDQTLTQNGYPQNGNIYTDPYNGPVPMVVHLHGGEMPSGSDGGPLAWFMPGYSLLGPGFAVNASSLASYPNKQEAGTLWYHPHDQGNTRTNVYTGLAGFYFLRGKDEEVAKLPGWSGDDKVLEVQPTGNYSPTFNGPNAYLPEIEVAIQDRMFNVNGELYWPVAPTNPDIHPFWTPEFFGTIMTVNGKTWPYLSVAPRKYRFRMLDGCNARFLDMWLQDLANGTKAPAINVVGSDGAFMDAPAVLDPALSKTLFMAPGERYDIIIDFSNVPAGTVFTLMNKAPAPYPTGDPVVPGLNDRIMQFVVNGKMVSAANTSNPGTDKSLLPANIRPVKPMVRLTDFNGGLTAGVTPTLKREILLNEVTGAGGPAQVLFNNSHFDAVSPIPGAPLEFGGPTETPLEGTTELISIINTTVDAHPIHIHLTQWQLVSRQQFDVAGYMSVYGTAWAAKNVQEWPAGLGYPGGGGSPNPYNTKNSDGAIGGNPGVKNFLLGLPSPAKPEEMVWKDDVKAFPGEVTTYIVRYSPTDRAINATPQQLLYPFDPSLGPGYVWHCHIIDHEDMDMMRPLMIQPSVLRYPQITDQPDPVIACTGDIVTYSVAATSDTKISYQWQVSTDAGATWTNILNSAPYSGALTSSLKISPSAPLLTTYQYHCNLTNVDGTTVSNAALLTVNNCTISGTLKYNNANLSPLAGFTVKVNGLSATTDASGAYTITGVTSGNFPVTISDNLTAAGGINSTDAGRVNGWLKAPAAIQNVLYLAGDALNDLILSSPDAVAIQNNFVKETAFKKAPWVFWNAIGSGTTNPPTFKIGVKGTSVSGFDILGMCTGDFNGSFNPTNSSATSDLQLNPSGNTLTFASMVMFDLPIKATSSMQIGAISLVLNVPSNLVKVLNVKVEGSLIAPVWKADGDELRIGWNSTTPVNVLAGGKLVTIKFQPTWAFTETETLSLSLEESILNELADGKFIPIANAVLKADDVELTPFGIPNPLKISVMPNPAHSNATVTYILPVSGKVNLAIYNVFGTKVRELITNQNQLAGTYTLNTDVSSLMKGLYYVKITLNGSSKPYIRTIMLIKN